MKNSKLQLRLLFFVMVLFFTIVTPNISLADPLPKASSKIIYLTFDGDMDPVMKKDQDLGKVKQWYDPALFDYLEKNNIPSTFFLTGMFAQMYPDLTKTIADNPNFSIQNHSYSHPAFEPNCYHLFYITTDQQKKTQIEQAQSILTLLAGKAPNYFRYPGLCHNAHDDIIVKGEGLLLAPGEFASGDTWMKSAKAILKNVLNNLNNNDNVVVFHVGSKLTPKTTKAVELLIPKLQKLGYTFNIL